VLESGRSLVLVAKNALSERAGAWLNARYEGRIACNGVLGGTGHSLLRSLPALREQCSSLAIVGNASTTSIITTIENGGSFADGLREAARLGYLEPDPELDLRGTDAAVKLAIVAGAVRNRVIDATAIDCQDIRTLDPAVLRKRNRDGFTTRLIARLNVDGSTAVAYEAVASDSVLAAPCGRVIYQYDVRGHDRLIYIGEGLGADATAAAAWLDVQSILRNASRANAFVSAGAL
jgi:homoserine dehydrogenase